MAFNFNWAPLSGDPGFYKRAEELLTDAMNKNKKPAIIVDDILVNELNLGDVPPDLDVVEISDIGVDKFRGTFKMSYAGNAFITIKTRVQVNPLNTYLVTRPSYTSPRPLAAATGLTIPLQITLSDFRLSAIIILVFSKQKGLTIVFRNDPLESLKVSSTFDSIPFVANYLQTVIEGQLRTLFMDELPAIIHRMSLRLWVPEHKAQEERALAGDGDTQETIIDPLASPPQDPVDSSGTILSPAEVAALSLDSHIETQSLFSRKNLLRLAALTDSHRTLSLFTPNMRDVVFRAWTGPLERGEAPGSLSRPTTPILSRAPSMIESVSTAYSFERSSLRPALVSHNSTASLGGHSLKAHRNRKRKKRVINLRRQPETGEMETFIEDGSTVTDSTSVTGSTPDLPALSQTQRPASPTFVDPVTPPTSPPATKYMDDEQMYRSEVTPLARRTNTQLPQVELDQSYDRTIRAKHRRVVKLADMDETPKQSMYLPPRQTLEPKPISGLSEDQQLADSSSSSSSAALPNFLSFLTDPSNAGSIAERAWMMKMATEVTKRYEDERQRGYFHLPAKGKEDEEDRPPPPAYAQ